MKDGIAEDTGSVFDDSGDQVRLIGPDGMAVDDVVFGAASPDHSVSREGDGAWHADWSLSLRAPNWPPMHLHLWGR